MVIRFDPHPNLQDCIALHHAAEQGRLPGTPIRVIRSANLRTEYWRQDATMLVEQKRNFKEYPLVVRCDALAATGERLGLSYVGLIVETVEDMS